MHKAEVVCWFGNTIPFLGLVC